MMKKNKITVVLLTMVFTFGLSPFSFSQENRYDSKGRRDPFVPWSPKLEKPKPKKKVFDASFLKKAVNGVVFDDNNPKSSAIIVGTDFLKIGDKVRGFEIVEIRKKALSVKDQNGKVHDVILSEDPAYT